MRDEDEKAIAAFAQAMLDEVHAAAADTEYANTKRVYVGDEEVYVVVCRPLGFRKWMERMLAEWSNKQQAQLN